MPAVSQAQADFFRWVAHDPKAQKEKGISKEVAEEFEHTDEVPSGIITDAGILVDEYLSPNISLTSEGFLICENAVIARTGTQEYTSAELNIKSSSGKLSLIRNAAEVFKPEAIASFEGVPLTIGHPPVMINPLNWKSYVIGTVQNVREQNNLLIADLIINDIKAIREVQDNGLKHLSCGYFSNLVELGNDVLEQTNINGNHVALVIKPRAGEIASIIDSEPEIKEKKMSKKATMKQKIFKTLGLFDSEVDKLADELLEDEDEIKDGDAHEEAETKAEESLEDLLRSALARIDALEAMNKAVTDEDEIKDSEEEVVDCKDEDEIKVTDEDEIEDEDANGEYAVGDAWGTFISKAEILVPGKKYATPLTDAKGMKSQISEFKKQVLLGTDPAIIKAITSKEINILNDSELTMLFDSAAIIKASKNNFKPTFELNDSKSVDLFAGYKEAFNKANK